jgi:hypothetical protein
MVAVTLRNGAMLTRELARGAKLWISFLELI